MNSRANLFDVESSDDDLPDEFYANYGFTRSSADQLPVLVQESEIEKSEACDPDEALVDTEPAPVKRISALQTVLTERIRTVLLQRQGVFAPDPDVLSVMEELITSVVLHATSDNAAYIPLEDSDSEASSVEDSGSEDSGSELEVLAADPDVRVLNRLMEDLITSVEFLAGVDMALCPMDDSGLETSSVEGSVPEALSESSDDEWFTNLSGRLQSDVASSARARREAAADEATAQFDARTAAMLAVARDQAQRAERMKARITHARRNLDRVRVYRSAVPNVGTAPAPEQLTYRGVVAARVLAEPAVLASPVLTGDGEQYDFSIHREQLLSTAPDLPVGAVGDITQSGPAKQLRQRRAAIFLAVELPAYSHAYIQDCSVSSVLADPYGAALFTVDTFQTAGTSSLRSAMVTMRALRRAAHAFGAADEAASLKFSARLSSKLLDLEDDLARGRAAQYHARRSAQGKRDNRQQQRRHGQSRHKLIKDGLKWLKRNAGVVTSSEHPTVQRNTRVAEPPLPTISASPAFAKQLAHLAAAGPSEFVRGLAGGMGNLALSVTRGEQSTQASIVARTDNIVLVAVHKEKSHMEHKMKARPTCFPTRDVLGSTASVEPLVVGFDSLAHP